MTRCELCGKPPTTSCPVCGRPFCDDCYDSEMAMCGLCKTLIVCPECGDWDDIVETADGVYHCVCGCEFGPAIDAAREQSFQRSMDAMCDEVVARLHRMIDEEAAKLEAE